MGWWVCVCVCAPISHLSCTQTNDTDDEFCILMCRKGRIGDHVYIRYYIVVGCECVVLLSSGHFTTAERLYDVRESMVVSEGFCDLFIFMKQMKCETVKSIYENLRYGRTRRYISFIHSFIHSYNNALNAPCHGPTISINTKYIRRAGLLIDQLNFV